MKRNKKQYYGGIGTVSHATMRPEDLIPSFIWEAKNLRLTRKERSTVCDIAKQSKRKGYYDSDDCNYDLEALFDILGNHSLPYFYFGSHPGDGSDYGWWATDTLTDDFDGLKVNDRSEVEKGYTGEVLLVNDHGNTSLYKAVNGRLYNVWSIV